MCNRGITGAMALTAAGSQGHEPAHTSAPDSHSPPLACLAFWQVVVQALRHEAALNKSFDLVAKDEGQGQPTWEWDVFFEQA